MNRRSFACRYQDASVPLKSRDGFARGRTGIVAWCDDVSGKHPKTSDSLT